MTEIKLIEDITPSRGKVQPKFIALADYLKASFVERDDIIDGMLACLVSGQDCLMVGPPGTAKSLLAETLTDSIDGASHFKWLLTRFSTPEELLGPVSLAGLEKDVFKRVTTGKLPEAHIAFLDEIFKANSAILNALLSLLNERVFHNNGSPSKVPLLSAIGASNEYPDGPELGALYDRFLVRWWVSPIADRDNFIKMLTHRPAKKKVTVSLADIAAARRAIAKVAIKTDALEMLATIKERSESAGIFASDRRWRQSTRYLRAVAWMQGDAEVTDDTFLSLADVLWREHKERPAVLQVIGKVANPALVQAIELFDACKQQFNDAARKPDEEGFAWSVRVGSSYQEIDKILGRMRRLAADNPSKAAIKKRLKSAEQLATSLKQEALKSAGMA